MTTSARIVEKATTVGDQTTIHFSDKTVESFTHIKSFTGNNNGSHYGHNQSNGGTSSYSNGSYGSSTTYSAVSTAKAFTATRDDREIEFWGTSKWKLDDFVFEQGDLIINCTGIKWDAKKPAPPKIWAMLKPDWLVVKNIDIEEPKKHNNGELAEQLVLDWQDMQPPPKTVGIDFWEDLLDQAFANGIKRIICCCQAGQGRTGTVLSSLLLASGGVDEPDLAIDYIREIYNSKAVETEGQEKYIFGLLYDEVKTAK